MVPPMLPILDYQYTTEQNMGHMVLGEIEIEEWESADQISTESKARKKL